MDTFEKTDRFIAGTYGRLNVAPESGSGFSVIDEAGKKYIDFGSGIGANSLGFCDDNWVEAVCNQVKTLQHVSNYYYNAASANLAESLSKITGYGEMFFGNSGAEANECAIKAARKYSFDKYGKGRHTIITLKNSFHGRTMATLSATGQDEFHNYFFPFLEGFKYAEANNIADFRKKLTDTCCAVMLEYIQGEGGVIPLEQDFVDEIYRLCDERDILVIADEIQTGAGRTGKFSAGEHYGKKADITTLAKGIGGGLPIGICLIGEKCKGVLSKGTHGSTFGGNPVACAGALAVINAVANPEFLDEITKKGDYIREKLIGLPEVTEITGKGLMLGISLKTKNAPDIVKSGLEKGILILTAKEKIRILPPLSILWSDLGNGVRILAEILN